MTTCTPPTARTSAARWPDVTHLPSGSRAVMGRPVAAKIFRHAVSRLPIQVLLPTGEQIGGGGIDAPTLTIHDQGRMMRRIAASGLIGFGESYLAGEWDADDLAAVIAVFGASVDSLVPRPLQALRRAWLAAQPGSDSPTLKHSRQNVARHYDLSNELFATFLDETMTYSSGLFTGPADRDLTAAQIRKIDRVLDRAGVGCGTRLLEVGTGWGGLAIRAARRGAVVDSVTLSVEQLALARERVHRAGLDERVTLSLLDYREVTGTYDAVVSIEMVEAVGLDFLPTYFDSLTDRLAPGGRLALQAITMPHRRALETRHTYTWIQKYIFPGGALPSVRMLVDQAHRCGLRLADDLAMGDSYATTLRLWAERFAAADRAQDALGFDETFRRMWSFYLRYSEGGFRSGYLDVHQLTFEATA